MKYNVIQLQEKGDKAMRIVIIGGGMVGYAIAQQLTEEGHNLVLIENNQSVADRISDELDIMTICGNGVELPVLREAGTQDSDLLIACTPKDEQNILACMFAKKLGCGNTIARVRSPEYSESIYLLQEDMGLSMIVNPELTAAREIFKLMEIPTVLKRDTFASGKVEIIELVSKPGDLFDGTQLSELSKKLRSRILICAVQRGGKTCIPTGEFTLQAGDKIYICAPAAQIVKLLRSIGLRSGRIRDVMLIGGSRIAEYLLQLLLPIGTKVKVIESNKQRAELLAKNYPKATVICEDATSPVNLLAQNVKEMDSVVTLTNIDEINMIISLYIKSFGVPRIITKVYHPDFFSMFPENDVDCIINPKKLCAESIVRYVRAMQNSGGSAVLTLHRMVDDKMEALEFSVTESTKYRGVPLKDIRLKPNILITSINKKGVITIPGGEHSFDVGDTVVIATTAGRAFVDMNDIFAR